MNKEYTLDIWFKASTVSEALANLERIQMEIAKYSIGDHLESDCGGLGWKAEINSGVDYDTSKSIIEKFAGIEKQTESLKNFMSKPFNPINN